MVYVLFLKCIKKQTLQCHILRNDVAIYSMDYRRVKTEIALAERLIILPALSNYCILFVAIIVVLIKSKAFHMLWPEFCFSSWEHVLVMPHKNVFKFCVRTVIIIWTVNSDVCRSLSWSPPLKWSHCLHLCTEDGWSFTHEVFFRLMKLQRDWDVSQRTRWYRSVFNFEVEHGFMISKCRNRCRVVPEADLWRISFCRTLVLDTWCRPHWNRFLGSSSVEG